MKIRIEFTNTDKANIVSHARDLDLEEGFAEKFQEVMWKVEEEIDKVGDLHTIYQRWSLREKYFAEMNITWRNPKTMNPDVMFD